MTKVYLANVEPLTDPQVFAANYRILPAYRKEKIDGLRYEKSKRLCLGAWLLLMHGLKEAGIMEADIRLSYGPTGKPYLADFPDVYFNLSHSGDHVFCAVSNGEVGCDVQKVGTADLRIIDRFFSPEECAFINATPKNGQNDLFFRFWTLKESFIKNIGKGLSMPLSEFSIRLGECGPTVEQEAMTAVSFCFREFDLGDGYRYACCARQPDICDVEIIGIGETE